MTRAIPARLLIHECVLKQKAGIDRDRNPTYSETVLKCVRIGATFQTVRGNIGETKADMMTLFIDAQNTRYETVAGEQTAAALPEEQDAVSWQGKDFIVQGVTPCFAQGTDTPHHWEVTLE